MSLLNSPQHQPEVPLGDRGPEHLSKNQIVSWPQLKIKPSPKKSGDFPLENRLSPVHTFPPPFPKGKF